MLETALIHTFYPTTFLFSMSQMGPNNEWTGKDAAAFIHILPKRWNHNEVVADDAEQWSQGLSQFIYTYAFTTMESQRVFCLGEEITNEDQIISSTMETDLQLSA